MTIKITMPALSPTMEEGSLAKWHVKEGDSVESGDVLAEIETDKATMEVESIDEGTVGKLLVKEGTDGVKVNSVIAILLEEGEDKSALDDVDVSEEEPPSKEEKDEAKAKAQKDSAKEKEEEQKPKSEKKEEKASPAPKGEDGKRIKASPLARRLAEEAGIDLEAVTGSGPHGRIVKADIESFDGDKREDQASREVVGAAGDVEAPYEEVKLSNMRKTIAKRLLESKQTVPHYYLTIDIDIDKLLSIRKELNAGLEEEGVKVSVNDFIIRASALALKKVPAANVQFAGDHMRFYKRADVSVAVATEGGLITPVVRGAEGKGLATIAGEVQELAEKARDGKLKPEEYQGGTFSISNLGMFGIRDFVAVINPPQAAILAVGKGEERAVVKDGAITKATIMTVTLSADHRAIDGAVGAEFLAALKSYLEHPLTMML